MIHWPWIVSFLLLSAVSLTSGDHLFLVAACVSMATGFLCRILGVLEQIRDKGNE